jgi:hypothetical protein
MPDIEAAEVACATDELLFDCPTCGTVKNAHLRPCDVSGILWVVCDGCYGRTWDGGVWDVGDVWQRVIALWAHEAMPC